MSFPNLAACGRRASVGPAPLGARSSAQPRGVRPRSPPEASPVLGRAGRGVRVSLGWVWEPSHGPRGRATPHPTVCGLGRPTLCQAGGEGSRHGGAQRERRQAGVFKDWNERTRSGFRGGARARESPATRPHRSAPRREPPSTPLGDSGSRTEKPELRLGIPRVEWNGMEWMWELEYICGQQDGSPSGLDVKCFFLLSENFPQASQLGVRTSLGLPAGSANAAASPSALFLRRWSSFTRPQAGDARAAPAQKGRSRARAAPYIRGGRRLRRARRGGAAFEVLAAAAFILSFFPCRPLCVTKFGKNMDPSQSFHVCSQLPAEKAKGSLPGKETGRKIKEFGELDLKCELKIKIKPGHIPVSKAKPTLNRGRLARTLVLPRLPVLFLSRNHS